MSGDGFPALADVLAAARRLEGVARRTPLAPSRALSDAAGREVLLKLETHQRTGSFKFRGAYNATAALPADAAARGVAAASAGNHGLGVALAASLLGLRARVFVPADAPEVKKRRIARLGAALVEVPGAYDDAAEAARAFVAESGAAYVHPCSDDPVLAGQGTVALEVFRDRPDVRTLLVPVGGGGLIGGSGIVARAMGSGVRVVGVQTDRTAAMHDSLAAGALRSPPMGATLCEGLSGDVDARAFSLARRVADAVVLVSESAVRRAMRLLYDEEGVVAEGSAAVVAAALMEGAAPLAAGPVAAVLTGGNVDARRLSEILSD